MDTKVQDHIIDYRDFLVAALRSDDFWTNFDGYGSFINDDEDSTTKGGTDKEEYQGLSYFPEIGDFINNSDEDIPANSYNQYVGVEVVLPDQKGE